MKKVVIILAVLVVFEGCSEIMKRVAVKELKFSLIGVSLIDYTLSDMTLKVNMRATNPNDIDAVIDRLEYSFFINDKNAANGTTAKKITVKAADNKTFATELTVNYLSLGVAILEAVQNEKADYRVDGKVYIDTQVGSIAFPVKLFYP